MRRLPIEKTEVPGAVFEIGRRIYKGELKMDPANFELLKEMAG